MSEILSIDIHSHIMPEHMPNWSQKFGYKGFIHLDHHKPCCARMMQDDKFFREIEHNCWDPAVRIKEYDEFKVQVQVISTIPVLFSYWAKSKDALEVAVFLNDHIAEIVNKDPKHYVGLCSVPLQDPELSIKELERCMKMGFSGVQIGTHVNDWNLNDPQLFPFFKACSDLGAAVFIHPWDMMGQDKMSRYWLPWLVGMPAESSLAICSLIFGGVFERLPNLRVAVAHGGGSFPSTVGRIKHGFDVRPDLCAIDNNISPEKYLGKFWLDSLVHEPEMLKFLVNLVGKEKVTLGSDYPFPLGELQPGNLIKSMDFDKETKEWLLHKSALEWLNLPINRFL